jgi:hypothetical protein
VVSFTPLPLYYEKYITIYNISGVSLTAVAMMSSVFWNIVRLKSADVSEEHIASMFNVEE